MYERYGAQVEFLAVYVREAHPTGGWRMPSNDQVQVAFEQPKTRAERELVAAACCVRLDVPMPLLVDGMDDPVGKAYSGMPDRLYLIDRDGRVAYKGGRGPFGFKPGEMEQAIIMLLLDDPGIRREDPGQTNIPLAGDIRQQGR
jgi:iodothyronine deiodinase-like protein